mmetsp:Transcript_11847/g.37048  ORF Transcript_11847/g.37048 Transcript_11847/m.37048 type:complete len:299 (+) Transcript_11847:57-953(+)
MAWQGWEATCCSNEQVQFIVDYGCFAVACFILWNSRALLPLKLFCTFLHEFGHATAAWLTCSRVQGIEVHGDQGGLTHWSSTRPRCASLVVLPAGYLASAAWACIIVVCSCDRAASVALAAVLCALMLVTLLYCACGKQERPECTLPVLLVSLILLLAGLAAAASLLDWEDREVPLRVILLLIGVMNSIFATYDIYRDCVSIDNERSDAHRFAESVPCCFPRLVGAVWFLLSLGFLTLSVWLSLLLTAADDDARVRGLDDLHSMTWVAIFIGAFTVFAAGVWHRYFSRHKWEEEAACF